MTELRKDDVHEPGRSGQGPVSEEIIWTGGPAERPTCVAGDIDGDGDDEFVITTRRPECSIHWFDRLSTGEWRRYLIDPDAPTMGVGGVLIDLTGNGRLDFLSGTDDRSNAVYWWEQPADPRLPWTRHIAFELPANRTHDAIVADFDGDDVPELVIWNQGAQTILHVPIPEDARRSPWPHVSPVVEGVEEQALAVADVDGDGTVELIAGCSWYRLNGRREWKRNVFAKGFRAPRLGAGDFDDDGLPEIVLAESDGSFEGITFGRIAVFSSGGDVEGVWEHDVLCDGLLDPHSLQVRDFDGDGRPDIYTGDMGLGDWMRPRAPVQRLFLNRGGAFEEVIFGKGTGTHEAQALDIGGRPGVIGKPFKALNADGTRPAGADSLTLWRW